jgi:hypothetical protein
LDVIIFYLVDDEKLLIHADPYLHGLRHISNVLCVMGYPPKLFETATSIRSRRQKGLKMLPVMLDIIRLYAPHVPLTPSGLLKVTIPVPGPINRAHTVINQSIPRTSLHDKPIHPSRTGNCVLAQMGFSQDERAREKLIAST